MGADFIEQDVVLSRDNIPVVIHDVILEHVTNVEHIFPDRKRQDGHYYAIDFFPCRIKMPSPCTNAQKNKINTRHFPDRFPISNDAGFKIATLEEENQFYPGPGKESLGDQLDYILSSSYRNFTNGKAMTSHKTVFTAPGPVMGTKTKMIEFISSASILTH